MSQGVIKIALAMAFAALLPSCFGAQVNTARPGGPVALAYNFAHATPSPTDEPEGHLPRVIVGHGVPVMVQTMTRTMPGWNRWNATHMITIFAFDFSHNDPALDTVTYAETPSPLAGYRGPDFQTISVKALWVAMQAYLREFP